MRTRVKGNRVVNKCLKELEGNGWLVSRVERTGRFVKEKDLFGLFDLCGVQDRFLCFVQVTCNRPHNHRKLLRFANAYPILGMVVEQWVWYDRRGWIIYRYHGRKKTVFDLRKDIGGKKG